MTNLDDIIKKFSFKLKYLKSHLKVFFLPRNVFAYLVKSKQGDFLIDPKDLSVGRSLLKYREYGNDEINNVINLAGKKANILFIGAHIGAIAIPVAKAVNKVTAIEANPSTFLLLKLNALLNECKNLNLIQLAAGEKDGYIKFVQNTANSGGSKRMPIIKAINFFYDKPKIIKIKMKRLDDLINEKFDLIFIDIEGSEYFALQGMQKLLSSSSHLIIEYIPDHLKKVSNALPSDLLKLISPHFHNLYIPSLKKTVRRSQFSRALNDMFRLNQSDNGIIFSKK